MANPAIVIEYIASTTKMVEGLKDADKQGKDFGDTLKKNWKTLAAGAAAAGVAYAAVKVVKASTTAVVDLATETGKLTRITDLDAKTASAWVETLKVRGISTDTFTTSLVKMEKQMDKVRTTQAAVVQASQDYDAVAARLAPALAKEGDTRKEAVKELNKYGDALDRATRAADKAAAPFQALGVNLADVKKGNVQAVLLQIADGLAKVKNPATRATLAAQLFGRAGQKLLPILLKGSKGIQEQLTLAEKYGAVLDENTIKRVTKLKDEQRKLQLAQDGVKMSIGSALIPAQVSLYGTLLDVIGAVLPLTDNLTAMKAVLIVGTIAWVAYKVAVIASTIASLGLNASLLITVGIIGAVVIALAAIAIGFYLAYKKVDWFRNAVDATFAWIKRNWPYILGILLGPVALAVIAIYKNWDKVRDLFTDFIAWLRGLKERMETTAKNLGLAILNGIVAGLVGIGQKAWSVINNIGEWIAEKAKVITQWGIDLASALWKGFTGAISGLGQKVGDEIKSGMNAVIRAWNALKIPGFTVKGPGPLPDVHWPSIALPDIPMLARGGIVAKPTLAMIGERGPEAVLPLDRMPLSVRVFIGDVELKGIVRSQIVQENNRTAQILLSGAH